MQYTDWIDLKTNRSCHCYTANILCKFIYMVSCKWITSWTLFHSSISTFIFYMYMLAST